MADAGAIRAGAAYVELSADTVKLAQGFMDADRRIKRWATDQKGTIQAAAAGGAGGGDDTAVTGRWAQSIARGAGIAVAAHMIGAGMSGLSHMIKGEWEKLDQDIASIPVLGGAAISLANGFDDLFLGIRAGMKKMREEALAGLKETQAVLAKAMRTAGIEKGTEDLKDDIEVLKMAGIFGPQSLEAGMAKINAEGAKKQRALEAVAKAANIPMSDPAIVARNLAIMEESTLKADDLRQSFIDAHDAIEASIEQAGTQFETDLVNKEIDRLQKEMDDAKRAAESLSERMMTPEERGKSQVDKYREMFAMGDIGDETARRAIQEALSEAAGAAVNAPEMRGATRGMYGAENAWTLGGASGVQEQQLAAIKDVAKNTAKMVELAREWGVAEFAP